MESRKRTKPPPEQDDSNSKRTKLKHTMQTMFRGKGSAGAGTGAASSTPACVNPTDNINELSDNEHSVHSDLNQPPQPDHATDENIPDPTNSNAPTDNLPINQVGPADRSHISRNPQVDPTKTKGKDLKRLGSGVLKSVASAFGPVKQVAEIFGECVDTYQVAGNVKVEYDQLIARLQGHLDDLAGYLGDDGSQSMTTSMERLCQSIQEELEMIRDKKGHSKGTRPRYLATDEDMDMILACYRRVEGYLERLSLNANLSIWKIAHDQATKDYQSDRMFSLIDRLPSVLAARFNSAEGEALRRRECTSGTRVQEIAQVLGWARNGVDETVYWLNGMAGTGKTTIAYSVCTRLESAHMLGASFFCSRLREECRDVKRIIPSIAYQLARFSRPFHHALCNALEKNPDAYGGSLQLQFNALIKGPVLHDRVRNTLPDELIVVIDALDECENKESTRRILEVLMSDSANLPIKFILSSRPEPEIRDRMTERVKSRLVLHELDKGQVQGDIEKYLREELATINPPDAQIAALVARAGILFIYAATAVRYIGYDNFHRNPTARLRTILAGPQGRITTHSTEIDQLYTTILRAALEDEGLEQDDRVDMQHVLYTMVCAREPLTVGALSELLEIYDLDRVRAALRPLWSVLHVVGERELVTTLHASFPDFMFDPARSKAYHCDSDCHNRKLAEHCFSRTQRNRPQFNVCRLKSSYLSDEMVPDIEDLIAKGIPLDLFYACRYWADHVEAGRYALPPVDELKDFLCNRLLLWIEVLNLKKEMRAGTECMKLVVKWCNLQGEQELMELAHDAQRFVESFALNTISQSTPHIYVSMLTFWPRSGPIAKHYVRFMDGPVHAEGSALGQRKLAHLAKWDFERRIDAMTVSSDGLFLALAVEDGVMIVDFASGIVVLGPLRIQRRGARSLVFSPDGSRIVYASDEYRNIELRGWDIQTGAAVLGPLTLQITRNDYSPYFHLLLSPDSTRIVAAADGRKIHLWDVENGDMLLSLRAKTGTRAVMFSSDSTRIAVGYDDALHIWDAQSGNNILSLRTSPADQIAFSHDDSRIIYASKWGDVVYVRDANNGDLIHQMSSKGYQVCLGYSPDGRYIVGGNTDSIITVWDAQTGKVMIGQLEGHRYKLTSVAFSPDGSYIITGCKGGIVCTWDARQHNFVHAPRPNSTCPMTINCIKFSPDGTQFVSGSEDGTIRIWDSDTGEMAVGPIKAHKDRIVALDFVDGRVASGSYDGAMCVCDALSGQILLGPLEVHQGRKYIQAIAYSIDRNQIVTGSCNNSGLNIARSPEVNLWNAQTGERILGPLMYLDMVFRVIRFSPDGIYISGIFDEYIVTVMWDVSNGGHTMNSHKSYSDKYTASICYSPDGALLASSGQGIFLVDAYTGAKILGPLVGHSHTVYLSVNFSPDGTRLASGAAHGTIQVWNVRTGEMIFDLLQGHEGHIRSIAYSPDGSRILSRSDDMTVRIHDARIPEERALSQSTAEYADWTMRPDGWVTDDQSRLLVWVPVDLRRALMWPRTQVLVGPCGYVRLSFNKSRMGESWEKSYTSRL